MTMRIKEAAFSKLGKTTRKRLSSSFGSCQLQGGLVLHIFCPGKGERLGSPSFSHLSEIIDPVGSMQNRNSGWFQQGYVTISTIYLQFVYGQYFL